jgi:hypothetical protein
VQNKRAVVQAGWAKSETLSPKITRAKRAGGMVQVTVHLPHKHKTLSSNPSTAKRKTQYYTKKYKQILILHRSLSSFLVISLEWVSGARRLLANIADLFPGMLD